MKKKTEITTIRVKKKTNEKITKAIKRHNERYPDRKINKDDYLSLLLDYNHNFGIDFEDSEKPLTAMNKLRKSVKSFNDSAWAAKKETEKLAKEYSEKINQLTESLALMLKNGEFLQDIKEEIKLSQKIRILREGEITYLTIPEILCHLAVVLESDRNEIKELKNGIFEIKEFLKNKRRGLFA